MAATSTYESITERQEEEYSGGYHEPDAAGCGCFRRFCFGWEADGPSSDNYLLRETAGSASAQAQKESWVVQKLKKLREVSEMVAGPKWKNLVRRIGRFCNPKKSSAETTNQQLKFQYSPQSYALNFAGEEEEEQGQLLHSFSTRFAPHASANYNDQHTRFGL